LYQGRARKENVEIREKQEGRKNGGNKTLGRVNPSWGIANFQRKAVDRERKGSMS